MLIAVFFVLLAMLGWHALYCAFNAILHPGHLLVDVVALVLLYKLGKAMIDRYVEPKVPPKP